MAKRQVTNEDLKKYEPMVEAYIKKNVVKNWQEASRSSKYSDVFLGNTGYTLNDIRQHLRTEVVVALQNFNPNFITEEGKTVKESTFVYQHLNFRCGSLLKKLVKRSKGYGIFMSNIDELLHEIDKHE